jgi:hypothetical protein
MNNQEKTLRAIGTYRSATEYMEELKALLNARIKDAFEHKKKIEIAYAKGGVLEYDETESQEICKQYIRDASQILIDWGFAVGGVSWKGINPYTPQLQLFDQNELLPQAHQDDDSIPLNGTE